MTNKYTGKTDSTNSERNCTYWIRKDGREFITDPNAEIVNLSRLTAYAEHGKAIYDVHVHHELPTLKIDAPEFLDALSPREHRQLHANTDPVAVDGIPLLRADQ